MNGQDANKIYNVAETEVIPFYFLFYRIQSCTTGHFVKIGLLSSLRWQTHLLNVWISFSFHLAI